jgi:Domain of unknown function (DUF4126)
VHVSSWLAVGAGVALAAACGLRAFLPLLLVGAAARGGLVELAPSVHWLASDPALIALAVATVVELAADKIPVVDHALDTVGMVLRPAAAWLAAYSLLVHWPAPWGQIAALLPALMALGVQGAKAKIRLGSTALTLGTGNPMVSVVEDLVSFALSAAALIAPWLALIGLLVLILVLARRRRRAT